MAHRILLAEDDRLSRLSTHRVLEKLGYEVEGVADGREAVDAEATGEFDAVIMDCQMPRMDGFQATAEIRRRQVAADCARIPIIGLSARAMEGDGEAAIAKGMDVYLTKPYTVSSLQAALELWIGKKT
jgi:CheY-like chemotaxis protein